MQTKNEINSRPFVVFVLLLCIASNCGVLLTDAKATNISNWTLPQEGFPVFYRFFRDKISWYEADAVCQFHHGNLVTVNNGIQFDATRAFLRELDVLDTVWIGLKGVTGSSQFFWANSQPLDFNAGYWAESFPTTEDQLCAAIDPTREYRWHALNCNGPTAAAFLCELPVPDWGEHCTVPAMPSVTIQFLSDSAAIRLTRDCGDEEGERQVLCQAGEDRASFLSQLVCNNNNNNDNASSTSTLTVPEMEPTTMTTPTTMDDEEATVTTENGVASAINKIVTEIQSIATNDSLNGELLSVQVKPRKQLPKEKKRIPSEKKFKRIQLEKLQREANRRSIIHGAENENREKEEAGVAVTGADELDPLPREKKMRAEDLKSLTATTNDQGEGTTAKEERVRRETFRVVSTEASANDYLDEVVSNTSEPAIEEEQKRVEEAEMDEKYLIEFHGGLLNMSMSSEDWAAYNNEEPVHNFTIADTDSPQLPPVTIPSAEVALEERNGTPHSAQPKGAITHPMHISSDMTKELLDAVDEKAQQNNKKLLASQQQQDHFVPPMLLVKAKFTPAKQQPPHVDLQENVRIQSNQIDSESPLAESTNDISKFYPASTGKPNQGPTILADDAMKNGENSISDSDSFSSPTPVISLAASTQGTESGSGAAETVKKYHSEFTFSNIENYKPYRPNRRRVLTKPETHSYLRKILGRH